MIKRIQNLLGQCALARLSSLFSFNYKSVGLVLTLFFSLGSASVSAQGVSIAFSSGYLGTQASATQQTSNIKSLSTLGIVRVSFSQSYAGTFGGTQGNDLSGIIRLYLNTGQIISLNGALNWRETTGNALDVFGLIFDPGQNATITYGSNQTYNIVGGSTNNTSTSLGLKAYASSVTFTDGSSRSGNAATSSIIQDINSELATSPQPSAITLTNPSVIEGVNLVYTVTLSTATAANRPQVFTFSTSGSAAKSSDYNAIYTFSNSVVNNGDGTITVPGGVSSFTITIPTIDDLLIESIESLILSVGSKSTIGLIRDNDVPVALQCDVNNPYDKIISGYHQSIAFKTDASFAVWGEDLDNSGAGSVLTPQDINSTNFPNLQTAIPLKAAIGGQGGGGKEQAILLTTAGLYAWGNPGYVIDATLTTSAVFAKILGNQFTANNASSSTGLPLGVNPYDVKMMTASYGTLIILTNSGDVWTLSNLSGNLNANGSATVNSKTWYKAKTNSTTFLSDITAIRVQSSTSALNAVIALKADGTAYTWGSSTYLGNATAAGALSYATQMTLPAEFSITNIPKMIAVSGGVKNTSSVKNSLYILSNSGALYSLGYNAQKQLGDFSTTERTSWVNAKVNSTTNFSNVSFITAQEHDASFPGVAAVTKTGDLYTWGENEGLALGRNDSGSTYTTWDPGMPLGFTSGTDVALSAELGGHTLVYLKQGTTQFCYVGHKTAGSMGDGVSAGSFINTFNCSGTPSLSICGSVPVTASTVTSTISATPRSITANGTSTSAISVQLKQANGTNLTSTGGAVIINSTKGTISSVTDNNDGTYSAILTSSTFSETANLTYTLNGTSGTSTTSVTFIPLTPTITSAASFSAFATCVGTASAAQSFTVSASNLTSNLTITAPSGFELATSSSGTYSSSIVLTQNSGTVSTTTLWARIKSATLMSTSGNISLASTGATSGTISVTAQVSALPTISVNVIPDVTTSATSFTIPYTGLAGADVYSISTGTGAMPSFSPVVNSAISGSPFSITIPASTQNSYDFILTVKNSTSGCSIQRNFSLVVSDINPGTTGADQAICYGTIPAAFTSLTDASSGGVGSPTYIWQISTTGVSGTYTDIAGATAADYTHPAALTADTYFRRKATIGASFATAHPIEVLVNALPTIAVSPSSASITTGFSVTLTASGANTYSWTPSTGLSATNTAVVTASPTSTTTYTVTGTNSTTTCSSSASVTVTVNAALAAGSISADQTICVGATPAALTSSSNATGGTGPISYVWQSSTDGTIYNTISGATSSTYSPGAIFVNTYFKRGASTPVDAVVYSSPVLITVQQSVGGSIAGSASVCTGTNSTVLTLSGHTGSITKWQSALASDFSGTVTDIASTTASITAMNLTATTYYRAVVTLGSCTAANSSVATVTVNALPVISVSPASPSISSGSSVTLAASGATTYSWTPTTGLSVSNTSVVTASPTSTTTYTITGVSNTSCSATTSVTVTVTSAAPVDSDGDGVTDTQEVADGTNANDPCDYVLANQTVTPTSAWTNADCDGDGTSNGTDTDPKDPCVHAAGATPVYTNAIWRAADCDGDGVTNGKEKDDNTDPNDGCSYLASSKTLTPSAAWNALDCDGDGTPNGTDTDPKDPCVHAAGATPVYTNAIWRAADCDGDGVTNGKEKDDNTDPNDGCSYVAASKTLTPSTAWNALDCDGDGTPNGADADPKDPCVHAAGATPVTTNAIWRAADCDGDGVTNGKETDDGTDPNDGCSYLAASKTLTPSTAWNALDCDGDGTPNGTDTDPKDPCVHAAGATPVTTNAIWRAADCDGDGVTNGKETDDNTDPNDGCSYVAASKTLTPSTAWNALDCDGDGTPNGTDTDPKDPCVHAAGATPVYTNAIWRAADCDGDGVTNGKETDDNTDPNNGCSFVAASKTLTPTSNWGALDCDGDGNPNATDPNKDTPVASNDAVTVGNSGKATINLLSNDDFLPGVNTDITRQAPPNDGTAKGTVTFNPLTGEMTYKRAPFESGLVTLGYRVTNKAVTPPVSATAFVTIIACDLQDPLADCDGDGEPNGTDLAPTDPCVYAPGRQVKANVSDDWKALDCDGDGVINGTELTDGTSPADGCSFKAPSITLAPSAAWLLLDCDADGITNKVEGTQDFDGDGIPNCLDTDSDGDSISDKLETTVDTDKDGKPDYLDLDSDNDGILDSVENRVCTGTGILCDTDADGKPNFRDLDSDADQISDVIEANGSDYNRDGIADGNIDEKGIPTSANKGLTPPDTDRDGKLDPYDVDSDGDGILDYDEEYNEDADFPDCDHDGIINRLDPDECDIFSPQGISPNGDGKNDRLVFKGLFLRKIPNHLSIYNRWGTLVYEMESYDNTFTGTSLPDGTYYYILDFFGKKPTISNYLSVDRTIK